MTLKGKAVQHLRNASEYGIIIACFYIALFSALEQTHCIHVACHSEWVTVSFYRLYLFIVHILFFNVHWSGLLTIAICLLHGWCHVKLLPSQTCTSLQYHHIQSHVGNVHVCLAVTCHLHFWQNDRDLLCTTVVTQGWNWCRNKSQHRKLTLEKKILQPLLW